MRATHDNETKSAHVWALGRFGGMRIPVFHLIVLDQPTLTTLSLGLRALEGGAPHAIARLKLHATVLRKESERFWTSGTLC